LLWRCFFTAVSAIPSSADNLAYDTSLRSSVRWELSALKSQSLPLLSHSSRRRWSACSTTVVAQARSNSRSGGNDLSACAGRDNCDGASATQTSQEINSASPPRLRAWVFSVALIRKFCSDLSKSERNRPRLRSACCNQFFFRIVTKKSCVRSCASSIE